jgi:Tol biopolymer transport system component
LVLSISEQIANELSGKQTSAWLLFGGLGPAARDSTEYIRLTDFADSAVSPTFSPDGRLLAFIRGPNTFVGPGQIYVKLLPDGEPVQLTHDDSFKLTPAFSPDGARIAYTVSRGPSDWNTCWEDSLPGCW